MKKIFITGGSGFIGTNLVEYFKKNYKTYQILSIDTEEPKIEDHFSIWKRVDILNKIKLEKTIKSFNPTHAIHLAARPSLYGKTIDDFPEIVEGTKNVVENLDKTNSMKRFIHVSTQFVCYPGVYPKDDDDYSPYTIYGLSKMESEKILKNTNPKFGWTILRPTNIWGPWHPSYPYEMWPYLKKRYFMHPGNKKIMKHYGYVTNVCYQMSEFLLNIEKNKIHKKVFYTTDPAIASEQWLNAFSVLLSGKKIRIIPRFVWYGLAMMGSALRFFKIKFPVDLGRYFRVTVNEKLPFKKTLELMDYNENSVEFQDAVHLTVEWLRENVHEFKVK